MLQHNQLPTFSVVEVEVNSRCNRKCSYCPVSLLPIPTVPRYMDRKIFQKLLSELARIEFSGRLSYHFYNEPLLRRDLADLVRQTSESLPKAMQVLYTNGDLLTDERYASLIAAGIKQIVVTSHDSKPYKERPQQIVLFPKMLHLTNRGGVMTNLPTPDADLLTQPCYAPTEMLIVTITGDVVLCYEDAERNLVMGNIMEQPIDEIWFSPRFVHLRTMLREGKRELASPICKACSNQAHLEPGKSFFAL